MEFTDIEKRLLRAELDRVEAGVMRFGTALGAMDHGGPWMELEEEGHAWIREAFARAPRLAELLPGLAGKLSQGTSVADEGFMIMDEVKVARGVVDGK